MVRYRWRSPNIVVSLHSKWKGRMTHSIGIRVEDDEAGAGGCSERSVRLQFAPFVGARLAAGISAGFFSIAWNSAC